HGKGIVYRDLKSLNVIVAPDNKLRLLDFDVCQEIGARRARFSPGTVGYMSRQQREGEPPRIEHDIYGLGALLYVMPTGAEPTLPPRQSHLRDRPLELLNPATPPSLIAAITRCLDADPDKRFNSMGEVEEAIQTTDDHSPSSVVRRPSSDHYRQL